MPSYKININKFMNSNLLFPLGRRIVSPFGHDPHCLIEVALTQSIGAALITPPPGTGLLRVGWRACVSLSLQVVRGPGRLDLFSAQTLTFIGSTTKKSPRTGFGLVKKIHLKQVAMLVIINSSFLWKRLRLA